MTQVARFTMVFLILFALILSGCAAPDKTDRTITVVGKASIDVPPDHMVVYLSVSTLRKDPAQAKKLNDDTIRSILSFLDQLGVSPDDIATGYLSLDEVYSRSQRGKQIFEGYEAETQLEAKIRDLALHDRLIEGALDLGLNKIRGIGFMSSEKVNKHREARKLAIRAAREKAEYLAAELGHQVGPALTITEIRSGSGRPWSGGAESNEFIVEPVSGEFSTDVTTQSVMPESIRVEEQVEVVFLLQG